MNVMRFRRIHPDAKAPTRAHSEDAGWDVCSVADYKLWPGDVWTVPLGLTVSIPSGWMIEVRPRSGLAVKHGVTVLNSPGTVDSGYQGEMKVVLINHGRAILEIAKGMRVAQLVPQRVPDVQFVDVTDEAAEETTTRGTGGWGSSGT